MDFPLTSLTHAMALQRVEQNPMFGENREHLHRKFGEPAVSSFKLPPKIRDTALSMARGVLSPITTP